MESIFFRIYRITLWLFIDTLDFLPLVFYSLAQSSLISWQ